MLETIFFFFFLVLFGSAGGADIIHFSFIIQFEIVILEFLLLIRNRK